MLRKKIVELVKRKFQIEIELQRDSINAPFANYGHTSQLFLSPKNHNFYVLITGIEDSKRADYFFRIDFFHSNAQEICLIEDDYLLEKVSFHVKDIEQAQTILNCIV